MRRIFSKSKVKTPAADAAASSSDSTPGYHLKEKDLPKLHKAAWNGDLTKFQQLSKKNDVYTLDKQNRTPLHLACAQGHVHIVNYLTSNPQASKLNLCDNDQRSALMKAVQGDFDECADVLLNNRADPNLVDKDANTALHLAAHHGFVHAAILLLNNGAMANPTNKAGSTPLHMAVSGKHDEMVEILLEGDADVNATDNENRTPLMLACQSDQIGMVKMLLDNKANTDVKDSKGWTANDHAIMGGFHGCSHLIDEFNASRRPKSSAVMGRPGSAGMFGSTTGSDALGFSIGGPAADNYDDDEDDDISFGKASVVDSWNASASEAEELPKTKPKMTKPVNLSKFVNESDNESVRSEVSLRSATSKSRIPRSVSRQGSITSERSLTSARSNKSGSKLPRPAAPSPDHKPRNQPEVSKPSNKTTAKSKRKDSWDSSVASTPRGSAPQTPVQSVPNTPRDVKGNTPREDFLPTPRGSILSALDTASEWDDDDVLDALEDTGTSKMSNKVLEQGERTPEIGKSMQKDGAAANNQRKEVLERLGMSDLDDESSVAFSDEDDIEPKQATLKPNATGSADNPNKNEQNNNKHQMSPPPDNEEDDDSEWDSDGDDLLPSDTDNKGPPVIRPGAFSRADDSEDTTSITASPRPQTPDDRLTPHGVTRQPAESPKVTPRTSKVEESPVHAKGPSRETPEGDKHRIQKGGGVVPQEGEDGDDDEDWDSEEDDDEEESEWERERASNRRASLAEELHNSGHLDELSRQSQWEEEDKLKEEKLRKDAEEELRREREEEEEERRRVQREEAERSRLEKEKAEQEAERSRLEKEKAAERKRKEEEAATDRRRRQEEETQHRIRLDEEAAEDRRRREEEEAEVERKREAVEAEHRHLEDIHRQEEERLQAEREQLEVERKREQEKRNAEKTQLEEDRTREENRLEAERRKLEEEKRQAALQRDEEQRKREQAMNEEERRIEAERRRLEEQRQQDKERQEAELKRIEEAKRQEELDREKERQYQESERRRLEEEKRQLDEHRQRVEDQKRQMEQERKLETERKKMDDERRKRDDDRLEAERKRHEEMRRQFEEDQLKMTQELKDEDDIRRAMEKKHLEDERQRLEEQRMETMRREREMEDQRLEEKKQLMTTQKELEELRRNMEDEKARFEQQSRDTTQQRHDADRRAVEAEKEEFEEAKKQEQDKLKAEKERLEAENQEIEKKRLEIQEMQKTFEKADAERTLQRYQQSIENQLADEDRSVLSVNGTEGEEESLEDITRDLEAAVEQRRMIESGTYSANPENMPGAKVNGMQSLAHTGEISAASFSQGNPLSSTRLPPAGSRQSPNKVPTNSVPLSRTPVKGLYNSQIPAANTSMGQSAPTWHTVLSEPDGLDYTSSEGEEDLLATQEGLRNSLRSPNLAAPSTPLRATIGTPGSPLSPSTNDATTVLRLQGLVREHRRAAERHKNQCSNADNQCKILQSEKAELLKRLDETITFKTSLDQQLLDLEAKIRGLEHELSQELERRHNSEVLLQKTKEQLRRKEELYAAEIEAKQKTELGSRNVQLDLRSAQNMIKQLEEERTEVRRQLTQERAARAIQEGLVQDQRRTHETLQEESSRVHTEKNEAMNRLEAADESRQAAMNQSDKLKTELYALKMELEKQKMRHRDDQGLLVSENEELSGKIEELKNDIRVSEEALAHATMTYNAQLAAVRTENAMLHNCVDKEKSTKEQLKAELNSVQKRLDTTCQELEKAEKARSELEHTLKRDHDEWNRNREKTEHLNTTMKDSTQATALRLGAAESRVASLEHELQAANTSLMERSNQLAAVQRDLDMKSSMQTSHESMFHKEREDTVKLQSRVELLTERLTEAQTEVSSLKRSLDAAQHQTLSKDKDTHNAQEKFNNTLTSLQSENDRTRTIWEERNNALQESVSRLKEEMQRSEHNSSMKDQDLRKLQQELTDNILKVSITENRLEMAMKIQSDLEKEKQSNKDLLKQLTDKISSLEKERRNFEVRVDELQSQLVNSERNNLDTSHQLMTTQTTLQRKADLEAQIRQLEKENNRLEMGYKQENNRAEDLAKKLEDALKVRIGLENMITNIKTSQLVMEDKLSEATAAKGLFAREVDDHKQLWETEVKSRSKLGLRIAQLERAKTEAQAQVDEEKRRTRKIAELKRSADDKLQNEMQRTQQLDQENATLRAKVKLAKKKLKDQCPPELRLSTMQTEFERERLNMEAAMGTLRKQLEDVNQQLDRESMLRLNIEKANRQLQQDMTSSKTSEKTKEKLQRSKRKLEDELSQMKMAMDNSYVEKGYLEKYKQDLDAKARMEINEKLEQVNSYLEEQSHAREKLEQLRVSNEAEMRKELEDTIEDLKLQLSRVRNGYHDAQTRKDTMEAETSKYKEMYNQEIQRREKISRDLEQTQDKLLEAQAKLNFERQRNRHFREGSYNIPNDMPAGMIPNKSSNTQQSDSIAEKVWSELDKSITRHLKAAPTDSGPNVSDLRSDRMNNSYGATSPPRSQDNNSYLATLRKNYFV